MKYAITLAAALLISSPVLADVYATANNAANSQSKSASGAIAGSAGNYTNVGAPSISTTESVYSEGSDLDDTVPNVFAPSLTAGSNLCAMSLSAGGSGAGFGITLGGTYESNECNVREGLRVMGAMLRKDGNIQSASILKSISCQSVLYWDSLELAAIETGNADLACKNERPKQMGRFELRQVADLPKPYDSVVTTLPDDQKIRDTADLHQYDHGYGDLF